jgi:hypothetical protein
MAIHVRHVPPDAVAPAVLWLVTQLASTISP